MPDELDPLLHQPVRTRIVVLLLDREECDYVTIRSQLGLSDGHMSTHMRALLEAGCVAMEKKFVANKPKTIYRPTPAGRKRFAEYLLTLGRLLRLG